jgi:hypothetical protein
VVPGAHDVQMHRNFLTLFHVGSKVLCIMNAVRALEVNKKIQVYNLLQKQVVCICEQCASLYARANIGAGMSYQLLKAC